MSTVDGRPVDVRIDPASLTAFRNALKGIDTGAPKVLRKGLRQASKIITDEARTRMPRKTGKARSSLKPRASSDKASLEMGGAKAPYFGFLDYGNKVRAMGGVGRGDSVPRDFKPKGRYVYPAIADKGDAVIQHMDQLFEQLFEQFGLRNEGGQ